MEPLTPKEQEARKMVCLPLDGIPYLRRGDVPSEAPEGTVSVESRVEELIPVVGLFKIGKETFTRFGPEAVRLVLDRGANVFIDLKYHDIPNTISGAADAATQNAAWMFNVHASGGRAMLDAAVKARDLAQKNYGIRPQAIAVTVLTSIGPAEYLDINRPLVPNLGDDTLIAFQGMKTDEKERQQTFAQRLIERGYAHLTFQDKRGLRCNVVEQQVLNLATMASEHGLDGVVCSAADLYAIKDELPSGFKFITPGIKGPNTPAGYDQMRVFTPGNAVQDGSTILVIGRAITDPRSKEQRERGVEVTSEMRHQAGYEVLQDMAPHL